MIPILGFINLDNKLILNLNWHSMSLQSYAHVVWAVLNSHKTSPFSTKMRSAFAENGGVGLENEP